MKIFLRYAADPGFQIGIAEDIEKIVDKAHLWIRFPQDNEAIQEQKQRWLSKYRFPTAIGAIDCTLIKIKKNHVNRHGHEYICRKQFPAIMYKQHVMLTNILPVLMPNGRDRTFNNVVLLGDQGYGIEKCLMRPYKNPTTPSEETINNLLKRERVIIERCFGQLKQRFATLQNAIRLSLPIIPSFIVACFVLHNVAKYNTYFQYAALAKENALAINQINGLSWFHLVYAVSFCKINKQQTISLSHSTISTIWKNRTKIIKAFEESKLKNKKLWPSCQDNVDRALLSWFLVQQNRAIPVPINGPILQVKAEELAKQMGRDDYKCSKSWIKRFRDRHNIVYGKFSGEAASVPEGITENWLDAAKLSQKILKKTKIKAKKTQK
ncbi:hypothetical protein Zmor_006234 [Zophobas morio]|uniref:HTH CENPB-type domain-containing protein n=1 Tax=Zophobas morio TaxID=2755281 RepID=A0AA38ITF5_9CUCU|nr:hypothetical protein Zmor_006234 [Zophobas morio]